MNYTLPLLLIACSASGNGDNPSIIDKQGAYNVSFDWTAVIKGYIVYMLHAVLLHKAKIFNLLQGRLFFRNFTI